MFGKRKLSLARRSGKPRWLRPAGFFVYALVVLALWRTCGVEGGSHTSLSAAKIDMPPTESQETRP
jgi:hypothetical protein